LQLLSLSALLLGSALLLFGGGVQTLLLPVRGAMEGFSSSDLGLLGAGWAVGYMTGCIFVPRLVAAVGHIRVFGVMCAFACVAVLLQSLAVLPWIWIPVRAVSGFCFAGAAMIVESWLNDRVNTAIRGRVFGIYTMVNLAATTAGQMVVATGNPAGFLFFALAAIVYCLALVPTALSTVQAPAPLTLVSLDVKTLWRNSPVSVVAVFLVGISNAAFGTLAAVYANDIGLVLTTIALFASVPVLAGAAAQIPVGFLSDRFDRRKVLIGLALLALMADAGFLFLTPEDRLGNLLLAAAFGATIYAMYPVIVAHANDHAAPGTSIQVSGGLLMIYAVGAIAGPLIAGVAMSLTGPGGLFMTTVAAHVLMVLYTALRIMRRAAVPEAEKGNFVVSVPARSATPETVAFAAGDDEAKPLSEADPQPEADAPPASAPGGKE